MVLLIVLVILAPIVVSAYMRHVDTSTRQAEALEAQGKSSCAVSVGVGLAAIGLILFAVLLVSTEAMLP